MVRKDRGAGRHAGDGVGARDAARSTASQDRRARPAMDDRPIHQVRSDGRVIGEIRHDTPVFVISVAAELAGMHAQTLRSYDREGLVSPRRTAGGGRRYSQRDIELLQQVQQLSQDDGVNRAGIRRIIELEGQVDALRDRLVEMAAELDALRTELGASRRGMAPTDESAAVVALRRDVVPWHSQTTAIVTWRPSGR